MALAVAQQHLAVAADARRDVTREKALERAVLETMLRRAAPIRHFFGDREHTIDILNRHGL